MLKEKNANLSKELDNKITENNRIKSKLGEVCFNYLKVSNNK